MAEITSGAEQTRAALVAAALKLFGEFGFEGTSTRALASEAKANIGSIAYHFGGKEGLRLAAADHIVATIKALAEQTAVGAEAPSSPEAAEAQLLSTLRTLLTFVVAAPQAGAIVQFVLRELTHPSAALDRIYSGIFEPVHKKLCAIWGVASQTDPDSEFEKLAVFTMIGQVVYFRIGREAVLRRMGWTTIGADEAAKIADVASRNLIAALAAAREDRS